MAITIFLDDDCRISLGITCTNRSLDVLIWVAQSLWLHNWIQFRGSQMLRLRVPLLVLSWSRVMSERLSHEGWCIVDLPTAHQFFLSFLKVLYRDKMSIFDTCAKNVVF